VKVIIELTVKTAIEESPEFCPGWASNRKSETVMALGRRVNWSAGLAPSDFTVAFCPLYSQLEQAKPP